MKGGKTIIEDNKGMNLIFNKSKEDIHQINLFNKQIIINKPLIDEIYINTKGIPYIYSKNEDIQTMIDSVKRLTDMNSINIRYNIVQLKTTDIENNKIYQYAYIYDTLSNLKSILYSLNMVNIKMINECAKILNILSKVSEIRISV